MSTSIRFCTHIHFCAINFSGLTSICFDQTTLIRFVTSSYFGQIDSHPFLRSDPLPSIFVIDHAPSVLTQSVTLYFHPFWSNLLSSVLANGPTPIHFCTILTPVNSIRSCTSTYFCPVELPTFLLWCQFPSTFSFKQSVIKHEHLAVVCMFILIVDINKI